MAASKEFDIDHLQKLFNECRNINSGLDMDSYVSAYDEISKLFRIFGKVFSFVASDVDDKVRILQDYRIDPETRGKYATIASMISYEVENNVITNTTKASGCRTLLRLHRALEFVLEFMVEICNADDSDKISDRASSAYDRTLAKFHPWLIRKGVQIAVYTLPKRKVLLQKMKIPDDNEAKKALGAIVDIGHLIYAETQEMYSVNNLLDLP